MTGIRQHEGDIDEDVDIRARVMKAIRTRHIQAKPRWRFLLTSFAFILALAVGVSALLYVASLLLFILREHGLLIVPAFGWHGVSLIVRSLPWLVLGIFAVLAVFLGSIVRRYALFYRRPVLVSLALVLFGACLAGFLIAKTPFHRRLASDARAGLLPPPVGMWYREPFRTHRAPELHAGSITATTSDGFVIEDEYGAQFMRVIITRRTMLPDGADFQIGERVMMFGSVIATGTFEAKGIRSMDADW